MLQNSDLSESSYQRYPPILLPCWSHPRFDRVGSICFAISQFTDSEMCTSWGPMFSVVTITLLFNLRLINFPPFPSKSLTPDLLSSLISQARVNMSAEPPTNQNMPINVKILMIGLASVGKTSLLLRFTNQRWLPEHESVATVGVDTWVNIR